MIPNAVNIIGYETIKGDTNIALTCEDEGQLRNFNIERENIISLFELENPTQKLLEIVPYLPISAVIQTVGLQIVEMHVFQNMQEAHDHVQTIACFNDSEAELDESAITTPSASSSKKEVSAPAQKPAASQNAPVNSSKQPNAGQTTSAASKDAPVNSSTQLNAAKSTSKAATVQPITQVTPVHTQLTSGSTELTPKCSTDTQAASVTPVNLRNIKKEYASGQAKKKLSFDEVWTDEDEENLDVDACLEALRDENSFGN